MNRRGHILRDASVDWAIGVMNDGHVIADFDSDLAGEGAHAEVKSWQSARADKSKESIHE